MAAKRPVWKVAKLARVSSVTGDVFPPDTPVVTALFGEEVESDDGIRGLGFLRKDFTADEATPERLAGAFCVWHTQTPPEKPAEERRLDLQLAREFLQRLLRENDPARAPVCMTLALLLVRKRKLNLIRQTDDHLVVRWPRETETFELPAPQVSAEDAEILQQDLLKLFDL